MCNKDCSKCLKLECECFDEEFKPLIYKYTTEDDMHKVNGLEISNLGRIKSYRNSKPRILKQRKNDKTGGYMLCTVSNGSRNSKIGIRVHRAVAYSFIENPNELIYDEVNHIDGNKENNKATNLEWLDNKLNVAHAIKTGLFNFERNCQCIKCIETNCIYDSVTKAAEYISNVLHRSDIEAVRKNIVRSLDKNNSSAFGYHWIRLQ